MEKLTIEKLFSDVDALNMEKDSKVIEYNRNIRSCNAAYDRRSELKREAAGLKEYIDISVEDRLEKITSAWALLTAVFSYDFLTFWGGEMLNSFLITMFYSVPISTIIFYICEIVFYDKFVQLLSIFSPDLRRLYDKYDDLNDSIEMEDRKIQVLEDYKKNSYNEIIDLDKNIDRLNSKIMNLHFGEKEKPTIVNGFTFGKKLTK